MPTWSPLSRSTNPCRYLGRLDVTFSAEGKVQSYAGEPIFIDESIPEDAGIAADVARYAEPLEELKATTVGQSAVDLQGERELVRSQETNLADLVCDAVLWKTAAEGAPTKQLGETNVGAFLLSAGTLTETLTRLHDELWDPTAERYATKSGELGFPNEMARALVRAGKPVIALPIAAVEESLGLRNRAGYEEVQRLMAQRGSAPTST